MIEVTINNKILLLLVKKFQIANIISYGHIDFGGAINSDRKGLIKFKKI
jgi:hypothetical protein